MPSENRPAPAVGQVWRDKRGSMFLLSGEIEMIDDFCALGGGKYFDGNYEVVYQSGLVGSHEISKSDTYVGQFRGFKVEGME